MIMLMRLLLYDYVDMIKMVKRDASVRVHSSSSIELASLRPRLPSFRSSILSASLLVFNQLIQPFIQLLSINNFNYSIMSIKKLFLKN